MVYDIITFIAGYSFIGLITFFVLSCIYASKWWTLGKTPKTKRSEMAKCYFWFFIGVICGPFVWLMIYDQTNNEKIKREIENDKVNKNSN